MSRPDDISQEAWDVADRTLERAAQAIRDYVLSDGDAPEIGLMQPIIARALEAAKAEERYAMAVILQDPMAVYEKWQQGAIDASLILFGKV